MKVKIRYSVREKEIIEEIEGKMEKKRIKELYVDIPFPYSAVEYNEKEGWAIIEISKEDYEKIKNRVIEVIEE